jgi:hypothetical protein
MSMFDLFEEPEKVVEETYETDEYAEEEDVSETTEITE